MPPHDRRYNLATSWCGNDPFYDSDEWRVGGLWLNSDVEWRIVDEEGLTVTLFQGPYAIDARELAVRLGVLDDYEEGLLEESCLARDGVDCWTAFELWVYLGEWSEVHCQAGRSGAEDPQLEQRLGGGNVR